MTHRTKTKTDLTTALIYTSLIATSNHLMQETSVTPAISNDSNAIAKERKALSQAAKKSQEKYMFNVPKPRKKEKNVCHPIHQPSKGKGR